METNRGHMTRCNVFWLVGEGGERAQWYGEKGSLYMANGKLHGDMWQARPERIRQRSRCSIRIM